MSQMYSWLVRARAGGLAGRMSARNSPKVPSQRCARCKRLNELSDSMKAERFAVPESVESDGIVLPSRFSSWVSDRGVSPARLSSWIQRFARWVAALEFPVLLL